MQNQPRGLCESIPQNRLAETQDDTSKLIAKAVFQGAATASAVFVSNARAATAVTSDGLALHDFISIGLEQTLSTRAAADTRSETIPLSACVTT